MIHINHVSFIKNNYFFDFDRLKHPSLSNITLLLLSPSIIFTFGAPFFNPNQKIRQKNMKNEKYYLD